MVSCKTIRGPLRTSLDYQEDLRDRIECTQLKILGRASLQVLERTQVHVAMAAQPFIASHHCTAHHAEQTTIPLPTTSHLPLITLLITLMMITLTTTHHYILFP